MGVLFLAKYAPWITEVDHACARAALRSQHGESALIENVDSSMMVRELVKQQQSPEIRLITVTDDEEHIFESSPPSPLDYAVMMDHILKRGSKSISLTTQMAWDDEPGMQAQTLSNQLEKFPRAVFAVPVKRGATAATPPPSLARSLVKHEQWKSSYRQLPVINQVALPAHIDGGAHTLAGFNLIESEDQETGRLQLFANWQEHGLLPSIDLLILMNFHGVSPKDLIVTRDSVLRLGENGPVIPMDRYGRARSNTTADEGAEMKGIPASDFISQPENRSADSADGKNVHWVVHADSDGKRVARTSLLDNKRISTITRLNSVLSIPGKASYYPRLPLWAEAVIVLDLALLVCWFSTSSRGSRLLVLLLIGVLIFPLLGAVLDITHHWLAVTAPLSVVIIGLLFPVIPRLRSTPIQEYDEKQPKPVLRV